MSNRYKMNEPMNSNMIESFEQLERQPDGSLMFLVHAKLRGANKPAQLFPSMGHVKLALEDVDADAQLRVLAMGL